MADSNFRKAYSTDLSDAQWPPKSTVYDYFAKWRDDGTLDRIVTVLR